MDISHYQKSSVINTTSDFVICKATEGRTYKDKSFKEHLKTCDNVGIKLVGAYHYAKTYNDVKADADNFINAIINTKALQEERLLLALDIEGEDLRRDNNFNWSLEWLKLVENATGVKPVIYISASYTDKLKKILDNDNGLWVANWNTKEPKTGVYPFWALWQYAIIDHIDRDMFNGTKEQYLKYCKRKDIKL